MSPVPESGNVEIRIVVPREAVAGRPDIRLRFLDAAGLAERLRALTARTDDGPLAVEAVSEDSRRVRVPEGSASPVVIEYTIDPLFPFTGPGQNPADARSRLTSHLGVIRTRSVFANIDMTASAHVRFVLPRGWVVIAPWENDGDGFLVPASAWSAVDYIGVGPFDVRPVTSTANIRLGTIRGDTAASAELIAAILERQVALLGDLGTAPRSLIVVGKRS